MKIAIIGAGLSGIKAAKTLSEQLGSAADIQIFEKSRGAGGRMSTRRTEKFEFDHGAQYFTANAPAFKAAVEKAVQAGHISAWNGTAKYLKDGRLEDDTGGSRYVSTPRMNSWIKAMAEGLNVQPTARVSALVRLDDRWIIELEDGPARTGFDAVISTVPSSQAELLLAPTGFESLGAIKSAKMEPCFAVMLGFETTLSLPWDTLRSADGPASWIAHNSAKPGRPEGGSTLMIHSGPEWSDANVDRDKTELQAEITAWASKLTGHELTTADYSTIHRWLYASVTQGTGQPCLVDAGRKLVACGDWCLGGRVEGAWLSGKAAAVAVLNFA